MKKLFLCLVLCLFLSGIALADGLTLVPNQTGAITFYDLEDHALKLGVRYPALNWKGMIFLDGAVITDFDTVSVGTGLNIEIAALGRALGLNVTLASNVNVGFIAGYNFRDRKPAWGPYAGVVWQW